MLKKTVTYEDYNGVERTEDLWFNLTEAELTEMELGTTGGFREMVKRIVEAQDIPTIMSVFKELIKKSYGVKSLDGKRFIKNSDVYEEFEQSGAYSKVFMELYTDSKAGAEFVNGILPKDLREKVEEEQKKNKYETVNPIAIGNK